MAIAQSPSPSPTDTLGTSTIARLNLKLIPFLMLLYLVAYIDRANISVRGRGGLHARHHL